MRQQQPIYESRDVQIYGYNPSHSQSNKNYMIAAQAANQLNKPHPDLGNSSSLYSTYPNKESLYGQTLGHQMRS